MDPWSHTCWSWRHRHRLSQAMAAWATGVSLTTWSRWERGRTEPPAETARRALALMTEQDQLLAAGAPRGGITIGVDAPQLAEVKR